MNMEFSEIMNIIKTFLNAILTLFKSLGLDKLFQKGTATDAEPKA